jgi:hypothetical protein
VLAAHLLGLDEVPCIVLAHLTPTQRRAYVLADNKLALNAGWDLEMLSLEIGELGEAGLTSVVPSDATAIRRPCQNLKRTSAPHRFCVWHRSKIALSMLRRLNPR